MSSKSENEDGPFHFWQGEMPDPIYDDDYRSYQSENDPERLPLCKSAVKARSSACAHGPAVSTMIQSLLWLTTIRSLRGDGRQICRPRTESGILFWQLIMKQRMTLLICTTKLVTIISVMPMAILRSHLPLTECTHTQIGASGPRWRQNWLT
jgi:hypothetical protein